MKKIRSIADISALNGQVDHILTLFSGGLDSTYLLELLKESNIKVTALAVDMGDGIDSKLLSYIAAHYGVDLIIEDGRQSFVEHSIVSAIQAQAMYLGDYPVSSSLSRPVIIKHAVEIAEKLNCGAICHTANQSQNSLRRLNGAIERSSFDGFYGSPYEYSAISREEKITSLSMSGLFEFSGRNVSGDSNLWCREFESGVLDNPEGFDLCESLFHWSVWNPALQLADSSVSITFQKGMPTRVNGTVMPLIKMVEYLNKHIGSYQIGRYIGFDHLENDEKVLEIREAPAASALMSAYRHLEVAVLETEVLRMKTLHSQTWTNEAVEGRWGSHLHQATQAFISQIAQSVSGTVTFSLSQGQLFMSNIVADKARYLTDRDAWEIQVANERSQRTITTENTLQLISTSA
ncbi:argininosuccinate synthase [Vibrio halioticoli NBRC 102217]|uniref:argininosuccinate synthase n=1 Tax=Vibrio halioticoli NBRC 102217 TaxID=1219072 RepID=V5FE90_9VIBR|nr:argininosuccinate synthase-related protein [Vibrio halioticoli]GAD89973.1 argininosuccinate synthase [Vibrio halioticoli NBRC 102217]